MKAVEITWPCCGRKIMITEDGGEVTASVLCNNNSEEITKALEKAHIELAAVRREGNDEQGKDCICQ